MKINLTRTFAAAAFVGALALSGQAALAQTATDAPHDCKAQLDLLNKQFADTGLSAPPKPTGGIVQGKGEHRHMGGEVTTMRNQLNLANHLCKDGKEHEAMLRMDVVRAMLKLPEVQHPPGHPTTK